MLVPRAAMIRWPSAEQATALNAPASALDQFAPLSVEIASPVADAATMFVPSDEEATAVQARTPAFTRWTQVSPPSPEVKTGLLLATATRFVPSKDEATPVQTRAPGEARWLQLWPKSVETKRKSFSVPASRRCPSPEEEMQSQFLEGLTGGGAQVTPAFVER